MVFKIEESDVVNDVVECDVRGVVVTSWLILFDEDQGVFCLSLAGISRYIEDISVKRNI